jgi:hemoglobin
MNDIPGLDEAAIALLVDRFYDRIREHPVLGPVFESRVRDWTAHKHRLTAFWCSTALRTGSYRGNPMAMHRELPVDAGHFEHWLSLWRDTVGETLPEAAAGHMTELAERIGHGLMLGMGLRPRGRQLGIPLAGRWSTVNRPG